MSRRLVALAAVLVMTLLSALALQALVVPVVWVPRTLVCVGAAGLVATLLRSRTPSAGLPSLGGLVAGLVASSAVYFPDQALLRVLPTPSTISAAADLIPEAFAQMRSSYPPLTQGDGVAFLVTMGVLVAFVLAEMLAIGAWAPAWSGLPMLTLWAVPILLGSPVSVGVLTAAAAAYVVVIAIQARDDARYRRRPGQPAVRATILVTASVLVGASVLAPLLLRVPVPIRVHPFYELVGSSTTRLDLGLGLRDDLVRNTPTDLFSYTGAEPAVVGPLHAYTVAEFTGSDWVRGDTGDAVAAEGQVLWPSSLEGVDLGTPIDIDVDVTNLGQDRLLLPGEPRSLEVPAEVAYLAASDEAVARIGGEVSYAISLLPRTLDGAALTQLQPATDVDPVLLQVPETGYQADIADLAREIVADAGAETPYAQLLALQNYLRDPSRFTYSTSIAAPETPDAVWDFLNDRHGYCVQFATTMIVMARTLGLPARLAVGFLPGEAGAEGTVVVDAHDAHAWPQVLFEGVGWVRFEPTPGVQAGPPPEYAPETTAPATEQTTAAPSTALPTAASSAAPTSTTADTGGSTEGESADRSGWLVALLALLGLVWVASALGRRFARLQGTDLRERWEHVLRYLERLGIEVSPSRTPRAIAADAAEHLTPQTAAALAHLVEAVETASYRPSETSRASDAEIEAWVEEVVDGVRATLRERSDDRVGV
ncbi:transglutaminaseTgpA domain-containing protein [Pseudactinotalea suaedae]|uniref:transglutaminaseTgpA domain-containing protein n=1 Tax=Pseudactinotalea suaedae TaxID=1524924 RepID=UPI0012E20AAA|nr:transglutaminaseTgpA domain-containing protein [Pseudactinotalea suaedae]